MKTKGKLIRIEIGGKVIECQTENSMTIEDNNSEDKGIDREMNLKESFEYLGISEHLDRAWSSSSTGELFFLQDYIIIANLFKKKKYDKLSYFKKWFNDYVDYAYKNWERPISIYQHIMRIENFKSK